MVELLEIRSFVLNVDVGVLSDLLIKEESVPQMV